MTCIIPNLVMMFAPAPSPIPMQYLTLSWSKTVTRSSPRAWMVGNDISLRFSLLFSWPGTSIWIKMERFFTSSNWSLSTNPCNELSCKMSQWHAVFWAGVFDANSLDVISILKITQNWPWGIGDNQRYVTAILGLKSFLFFFDLAGNDCQLLPWQMALYLVLPASIGVTYFWTQRNKYFCVMIGASPMRKVSGGLLPWRSRGCCLCHELWGTHTCNLCPYARLPSRPKSE